MSFHQYYCKKCKNEFELNLSPVETNMQGVVDESKGYVLKFLVSSLTEEEIKNLPMEKDPRDFEEWEEVILEGIPEKPPCMICGSKRTEKVMHEAQGWVKGNCFTNRERERKFYENGLDKQQAHRFYQESIEASKERIKSSGIHYKRVDPNLDYLRKTGQIKKVSDKQKSDRIKGIDAMNKEMAKRVSANKPKK